MDPIDYKYVGILSTRLERYSVKSTNPYRANCRCPVCGDSQKSKTKTRGWFLENTKTNLTVFYCHNCHASMSLGTLLKNEFPSLYSEYVIDSKMEGMFDKQIAENNTAKSQPKYVSKKSPLKEIQKLSTLNPSHPARLYVDSRKIPTSKHYKLYYAKNFSAWVNSQIPDKLDPNDKQGRLVIPFLDKNKNMFGFAGRSLDTNEKKKRYITIMLDDKTKVFGLDTVDLSRDFFVTEGQLDSLFLSNAIAMAGSDLSVDFIPNPKKAIFVLDNEPRNKQIVQRMEKLLDEGMRVCIWPDVVVEKDINDMILSGNYEPQDIENIILQHTHDGLMGKLILSNWRK